MNQPIRVYVDTCVFGGTLDKEFALATARFFEMVRDGRYHLVISSLVVSEISVAPQQVLDLFNNLQEYLTVVDPDEATLKLQRGYLNAGIVSPKWSGDALHVALATTSGCDLIVSWNFQHLVNYRRIKKYGMVNTAHGYPPIAIHTPEEVLDDEE